MKKLLSLSLLCLFFASCNTSRDQTPLSSNELKAEQQKIQQLIQDSFDDIFSALDTSKVKKYYTSDFLLLENGELWDSKSVQDYQLDAASVIPRPSRINKFDFIKTEIKGNQAWTAYHNYATISFDGKDSRDLYWLESATAIKQNGQWKLQMLHSTYVPEKK